MAIITLNNNSLSGVTALPAGVGGKVLQVVSATLSSQINTTSTADSNTGLNASITPSSTSSKILIQVSHSGIIKYTGNTLLGVKLKLFRDTTELKILSGEAGWNNVSQYQDAGSVSNEYLDSPASISSLNYKTTIACANAITGINVGIGSANSLSSIVLMEIAG